MRAKVQLAWAMAVASAGLVLLLTLIPDVRADPAVDEITLIASPTDITANGLTTATLTATVKHGGALQDGVPVVFTSTLGLFPNWKQTVTVTTTQGLAVTWLRSVPASGTVSSTVRASASTTLAEAQIAFRVPRQWLLPGAISF